MAIKVWVEEGCSASGLCSNICPEVFILKDFAEVIPGVDYDKYAGFIKEAAENCPSEVIKYREE